MVDCRLILEFGQTGFLALNTEDLKGNSATVIETCVDGQAHPQLGFYPMHAMEGELGE